MPNLADELQNEIKRVNEIIAAYKDSSLKGAGDFTAALMQMDIDAAMDAAKFGDVIKMIQSLNSLQSWTL